MRKKLFFKLILLFALIGGGLFLAHPIFAACNTGVDIYIDGETAPSCSGNAIFNEGNWVPGSKKGHTVEFRNVETDKDFPVYFEIENAKGNFAKRINLAITCDGGIYTYNKTLADFYNDYPKDNTTIIFTLNKGESKICTFQTAFNPMTNDQDNEYNCQPEKNMTDAAIEEQCATSFDLKFGFEITTTETSRSGGESSEWFWQAMNPDHVLGAVKAATSPIVKATIKLPGKLPRVGAWSALVAASMGLFATVVLYRRKK